MYIIYVLLRFIDEKDFIIINFHIHTQYILVISNTLCLTRIFSKLQKGNLG